MPKKNGFLLYIESRRSSLLAKGHSGNLKELVDLCDPGWRELAQEEKKKFSDEAKAYNERMKKIKGDAIIQAASLQPTPVPVYMDPKEKDFGRAAVCKIFENLEWISQPIVVCSFSLYVDPGLQDMYLPAEIGLSAFSLKNGVMDNFARIIDPGEVPRGYGIEAFHNAKKLGVPEPGSVPDFANYEPILMIVESFLQKYKILLNRENNLYVFVFDSDYIMVAQCLEWLFNKTGYRLPIKILSLTLWCFLASTYGAKDAASNRPAAEAKAGRFFKHNNDSVMATVSRHRVVGQPLIGNFIYSTNHPMAAFGLFVHEEDVEGVIKEVDNYKYFEELCCIYHVKNGVEIQNCALNTANRFAFSILEVLTLSNDIPIVPGEHFPQIDHPSVEKRRRYNMLRKWGISNLEEEMEIRQHADFGPPTPPDRSFRNIERRREAFAECRRRWVPRATGRRRSEGDYANTREEECHEQQENIRPFSHIFTRKNRRDSEGMASGRRGHQGQEEMELDEDQDQDYPSPSRQSLVRKPERKSGGIRGSRRGQQVEAMEEDEHQDQNDPTPQFQQTRKPCQSSARRVSFEQNQEEDDDDYYSPGGMPRGIMRRRNDCERDCERRIEWGEEVPSIFYGLQDS